MKAEPPVLNYNFQCLKIFFRIFESYIPSTLWSREFCGARNRRNSGNDRLPFMLPNCFLLISEIIIHLEEKFTSWTGLKTSRQIALVPQASERKWRSVREGENNNFRIVCYQNSKTIWRKLTQLKIISTKSIKCERYNWSVKAHCILQTRSSVLWLCILFIDFRLFERSSCLRRFWNESRNDTTSHLRKYALLILPLWETVDAFCSNSLRSHNTIKPRNYI